MPQLDPQTGLPIMPSCPNCQAELPDVFEFPSCSHCGTTLDTRTEPPPPAGPAPSSAS